MLAAGCAVALALVWCLAELVPAVHLRDGIVLGHFTSLSGPHINHPLRTLLHLLDPSLYVLWGIALVARRPGTLAPARGARHRASCSRSRRCRPRCSSLC